MDSLKLTQNAVKILDNKKADRIEVIKVRDVTILADYFIIASATNTTHVKSLADELEFELKNQYSATPERTEGYQSGNWIILDYKDVVVHIFYKDTRELYSLEKLWSDGEKIDVSELLK